MKVQMSSGVTDFQRVSHSECLASGAPGGQILERDRVVAGAGHPHHLLEQRQLLAHGADLLQLLVVLDDDDLGVGVLQHVLALLGRVGLVDRHDGCARRESGEIEIGPLGPGVGEDRDLVALFDSKVDQAERKRTDHLQHLGKAAACPLAVLLEAHGGMVAIELCRKRQQVRQRDRFGSPLHPGRSLVKS